MLPACLTACLLAYFPCLRVLLVMRKRKNAIALRFACDMNIYTYIPIYVYVHVCVWLSSFSRILESVMAWCTMLRWYVSTYMNGRICGNAFKTISYFRRISRIVSFWRSTFHIHSHSRSHSSSHNRQNQGVFDSKKERKSECASVCVTLPQEGPIPIHPRARACVCACVYI